LCFAAWMQVACSAPVRAAPAAPGRATPAARSTRGGAAAPPTSLGDLNGWLDYKARGHVIALPIEARIFYRRGLLAQATGMRDEGERWVRGAAELDPSLVGPHLALARWALPQAP